MKYIALLRGINVGGHKKIKMADLRAAMTKAGFSEVQTYIQSGNIVVESDLPKTELELQIKQLILTTFAFDVPVVVRTAATWSSMMNTVPYDVVADLNQVYVVFLHETPSHNNLAAFTALRFAQDQFIVNDQHIYIRYDESPSKSKLSLAVIEKNLNVSGTARNWKTVKKMAELVED